MNRPNYETLVMWVITYNPRDASEPNMYVARKWEWDEDAHEMRATPSVMEFKHLIMLRETLVVSQQVSLRIDRAPDDDPVVVETWI